MIDDEIYWAAEDDEKLAAKITERFERYRGDIAGSPRGARITQASLRFFGFDPDPDAKGTSSDLIEGGEQGELLLAHVNNFRSLVRSLKSMATSSRPAFDATASDDSADSIVACELAEQIWDYEQEIGLEHNTESAADRMLVQGEVAVGVLWDPNAGPIAGAKPVLELDANGRPIMQPAVDERGAPRMVPVLDASGQPAVDELGASAMKPLMLPVPKRDERGEPIEVPIHEGKLVYIVLGPYDVARDPYHSTLRTLPWVIVRRPLNRWDLMASYRDDPELLSAIRGATGPSAPGAPTSKEGSGSGGNAPLSDQVYVYELYHDRTHALPEGRIARVCGNRLLFATDLGYEEFPWIVRAPAEEFDRAVGYTESWDLLGLSKAIDGVVTDMLSLVQRHGSTPFLNPTGSEIETADVTRPGSIDWKWQAGMPVPQWLKAPEIPASFMQFLEWMTKAQQLLIGMNSVVRGDPEASLKSGAALALVAAQAVQHANSFVTAYADLLCTVATRVIQTYRRFAMTERLIEISGNQRGTVRSFTGDMLRPVRRIKAELANPLMRHVAGKMEIAKDLRDGFPDEPPMTRAQWITFLRNGRYEPAFRADKSQLEQILFENDRFIRGEPVMGRMLDHHEMSIREHNVLLDGRQRYELSPEQVNAIEAHITWHGEQWVKLTMTNPALLAATNQRPAPMVPMGPPGAPGAPGGANAGAPEGSPPPDGPPKEVPPVETTVPAIPGAAPPPASMPRPPTNPATGKPAQLPTGAMR